MDEEVDESHLTVGKVNCISIAEHCYFDSKCLLFVSLLEELRHDSLRPNLRHFKWPRWITNIGSMNQCLQEALLILTLKVSVSFTHFFERFKITLYGGMFRHIGTQYIFDYLFSWFWFLLICELWKDVAVMLLILKQKEETSCMMVLKNWLVIVKNCKFWSTFDLKGIVVTRMIHIMCSSRQESYKDIEVIHVTNFVDSVFSDDHV